MLGTEFDLHLSAARPYHVHLSLAGDCHQLIYYSRGSCSKGLYSLHSSHRHRVFVYAPFLPTIFTSIIVNTTKYCVWIFSERSSSDLQHASRFVFHSMNVRWNSFVDYLYNGRSNSGQPQRFFSFSIIQMGSCCLFAFMGLF